MLLSIPQASQGAAYAALEPALWLEAAIWLPATAAMCLALLPFIKGAAIGLCWATNLVQQDRAA